MFQERKHVGQLVTTNIHQGENMLNKKQLATLIAVPIFFMACGDDSSSSANKETYNSCVLKFSQTVDGKSSSFQMCAETVNPEETKSFIDASCYDNFNTGYVMTAKKATTCPSDYKKTCERKDFYGNHATYYIYDKNIAKMDCEKIISYYIDVDDIKAKGNTIATFDSDDSSQVDFESLTENEKEFEHAYQILNYYYLFAHTDSLVPEGTSWYRQLSSRSNYKGKAKGKKDLPEDLRSLKLPSEIKDAAHMFYSMHDMYTEYYPPQYATYEEFIGDFEEREPIYPYGFEVDFIISEDSLKKFVKQVFTGSSAEEKGVLQGDTIISNNIDYDKNIMNLVVVRNENGKLVKKEFSLTEKKYYPPSVTYEIIDSIAMIHISEFASENTPSKRGTYGEFLEALKKTENTKATVIDLLDNPGGDMDQCDSIARTMLHKNDTIAFDMFAMMDGQTHKPIWTAVPYIAEEDGIASDRYIVFLANEETASCAEYTMMGVTNARKSPVVGTTTYGKGVAYVVAQSYLDGTFIFTMDIFLDKNFETYHMRGFVPDVEEKNGNYDIRKKGIEIAKEGTMKRTQGYGDEVLQEFKESLHKNGNIHKKPTRADLGLYRKLDRNQTLENLRNR